MTKNLFLNIKPRFFTLAIIVLPLVLTLSACSDTHDKQKSKSKGQRTHLVATTNSIFKSLSSSSTRTGTLKILRRVKIFNQEDGKITKNHFYPGEYFKRNDVLINIDGSLLQAQLDKAIATRRQAEQDLKRINSLVKKRLAPADEKARIATTLSVASADEKLFRTRLRYTTINAPFDGVVSERLIEPGDVAPRHTHLLTIIDPLSLVARINVSELLINSLKIGDPATITIDALGKKQYNGIIKRIYPTINSNTRLGTIEVTFNKIPALAKAGSLCRVTLTPAAKTYLVIPFTALRRDSQGEYVYIIEKQQALKKYVHTTTRYGNLISISSGLAANTAVVTKGFLGLREGKKISTGSSTNKQKN